jgi:hypothetical protein
MLLSALSFSPALAATQDDPLPCSQRYKVAFALAFGANDIGKPAATVLARVPMRRSWGLAQNLSLVPGEDRASAILQARFPKGSIDPGAKGGTPLGGAGFQAAVLAAGKPAAACLTYGVRFADGFQFGKGGKLPGLYGGEAPSGCRAYGDDDGFSLRYMWRAQGMGELYAYLPGRNERCGESVSRGAWRFVAGRWTVLEQEAVLNAPGRSDGALRVWVDGNPVISRTNVVFRQSNRIGVDGLMFSTFFGGSDPSWASPTDQWVQFRDFRLYLSN